MEYALKMQTEHWSCGDGCCDGTNTTLHVNGILIGGYADISSENLQSLKAMMELLNAEPTDYVLSFSVALDEDGDLQDAISLNGTDISNTTWNCAMFADILDGLDLPYLFQTYELDWAIWDKEKRLVVLLEEEERRNQTQLN